MPKLLGMRTACEWHRKQLLQAHLRMDQRNVLQVKKGQIPVTLTTSLTCNHAHEDVDLGIIATDTPLHRNPDNPQLPYPFCYVQAERSARLEQEGYDQVTSPVVHEAFV